MKTITIEPFGTYEYSTYAELLAIFSRFPNIQVGHGFEIGSNAKITDHFYVGANFKAGNNLSVSFGFYAGANVKIGDNFKAAYGLVVGDSVVIGDYVLVGYAVTIVGGATIKSGLKILNYAVIC